MPQRPDLFGQRDLDVQPAKGMQGPKLWVKRLVIWREPGGEIIRNIELRPGLNIVWSPDGADTLTSEAADDTMGHGSGKTLFCRLLRYCLGEDRFAPKNQRERIGAAFLNGLVGAEVILDGVCWAIVRPLGARRRHMAIPGGNLDDVAAGDDASTSLDPFLDAIEKSVLTAELSDLIPGHRQERRSWPIAIAWLMRDQECRFDHLLDWRSTTSESESPAGGLTQTEKLDALRAFLIAITPEEMTKRAEIANLEERRRGVEQELGHTRWEIERARTRLLSALNLTNDALTEGALGVDMLRKAAQARLATTVHLSTGETGSQVEKARQEYEAARAQVDDIGRQLSRVEAQIPEIEKIVGQIRAELPGLSFTKHEAQSPICPICEVPIDRALADGCGLSHKLPDLESCQQRWVRRQQELATESGRLDEARSTRIRTQQQLAIARQTANQLATRLAAIEKVRDAREAAWYSARKLVDDVSRLGELIEQQETTIQQLREVISKLETERERVAAFRDMQARVFGRLSEKFDPIVRQLVGSDGQGRIALTGNSLELTVSKQGDRSTAAIDSLKVLAFDLSALCLSIEGATRVPAFLVHDSPREADLGLLIYHRLFQLAQRLESVGERPLFQYIVTTTTRPPAELAKEPWLRLSLRGGPASERLLRCDL